MGLDFLTYINDSSHCWDVLLGLPYGTHAWQVADSEEQNGAMRCSAGEVKKRRFFKKRERGFSGLSKYDIVFIVKESWKESFARIETNKQALCDRGWNPLNYNLLLDPEFNPNESNLEDSLLHGCSTLDPKYINVDDGFAGNVISMLSQHQDKIKRRESQECLDKKKNFTGYP